MTILETVNYTSSKTGRQWDSHNSVYYDCHVTSLAQVLPKTIYYYWLIITSLPNIEINWGGLTCRNKLDSEAKRDEVLLNSFNLIKENVPITGDIERSIQLAIVKNDYCICRVDSYYHEFFEDFYLKEHRTNGHKVTVIDWDDEYYYGIDNLGIKTLVFKFKREWFLESIYSNLFHVYEKEDTLYYITKDSVESSLNNLSNIENICRKYILRWYEHRKQNQDSFADYYKLFEKDISLDSPRDYAQIRNSYTTSLMIETSYTALRESYIHDPAIWYQAIGKKSEALVYLDEVIKAWKMFKILCKLQEKGKKPSNVQLLNILNQVVSRESQLTNLLYNSEGIKK